MESSQFQEIERKFLVRDDRYLSEAFHSEEICQGYLSDAPERVVRIRIKGKRGFITIKGKNSDDGTSRFEWEKDIPPEEARLLLELCLPGRIEKTRYCVKSGAHTIEVDAFHGKLEGLVVAEIELKSPDEPFERPEWLGQEVTGDPKYANAALSRLAAGLVVSGS